MIPIALPEDGSGKTIQASIIGRPKPGDAVKTWHFDNLNNQLIGLRGSNYKNIGLLSLGVMLWKKQCAIDELGEEAFLPPPKISGAYPQRDDGTLRFYSEDSPDTLAVFSFTNDSIEGEKIDYQKLLEEQQ